MNSILFIFDIDETLLQMCSDINYKYWVKTSINYKKSLNKSCGGYILDFPKEKTVYIFRPYLKKLFTLIKKSNGLIKMALWTYGSKSHAEYTANAISNLFNFNDFIFTYSVEDIPDNKYPKNLSQIWEDPKFKGIYSCSNTFLVDNLFTNNCHYINKFNSILIQSFEPYGPSRDIFNYNILKLAIKDKVILKLIILIKKMCSNMINNKNNNYNTHNTFPYCFNPFIHKNLKKYIKSYSTCNLITVGNIIEDESNSSWTKYLWSSHSFIEKKQNPLQQISNEIPITLQKSLNNDDEIVLLSGLKKSLKTKKNKLKTQTKKRSIKNDTKKNKKNLKKK